MQCSAQTQRDNISARTTRPIADKRGNRPACREIVGHPRDQFTGEGRTEHRAVHCLFAEMIEKFFRAHAVTSRALNTKGNALAATDAERSDTALRIARFHRRQQRHQHAGAGGADRMAQRTGAAIDVDIVERDAQFAHRDQRHHGERFIDFPEIDVTHLPTRTIQRLLYRRHRRRSELRWMLRMRGLRDDARDRLLRLAGRRQHQRRRAIGNRGGIRCRDRTAIGERRLQRRNLLRLRLTRQLIRVDVAELRLELDDLALEAALLRRVLRPRQRLQRVGILSLARELVILRGLIGVDTIARPS